MCNHDNREAAMVIIDPGTPERHGRDGIWCDPCLEQLIRALNAAGMATAASCCGHGHYPGWVMLRDGRDIVIYPDHMSNLAVNDPQLHASLIAERDDTIAPSRGEATLPVPAVPVPPREAPEPEDEQADVEGGLADALDKIARVRELVSEPCTPGCCDHCDGKNEGWEMVLAILDSAAPTEPEEKR